MEVATVNRPNPAVVFHHTRDNPRMDVAAPNPAGAFVFHPPSRRRHGHHHRSRYYHNDPSDSDTDPNTFSTRSSCSSSSIDSDSDDGAPYYHNHRLSFRPRHRARRRRREWWGGGWPRVGGPLLAYPESYYASPWATTVGAVGAAAGLAVPTAPVGLVTTAAGTVVPQIQLQQTPAQQQQQQQPRRYGYRRFHYQGGERVRSTGCGHGHGHGHHHHHHHNSHNRTSAQSPRRCILPRFGRWLVGDPPGRVRRGHRCEDGCGGGCCDDGCGVGGTATALTPTVHHEDEYWGPGHPSNIPNWATGSQSSPWRYGGPNGNLNNGPGGTVGPGGTIEEIEEGGTAPVQPLPLATTTLQQPTAVLPVPVATPTAIDPYDQQQPKHTHHYHLNDDKNDRRRRGRRESRHTHRRHHHRDDVDNSGILGLVERERRRDSERQMADADASHRREAMMMELMERARKGERERERDRDRGGGDSGGLDARDILGLLLDGVAERNGRREGRCDDVKEGVGKDDRDDALKDALDALSRRVDEMVLSDRGEKRRAAESVAAPTKRKMKQNMAPRVKFNGVSSDSDSVVGRNDGGRLSGAKKGAAVGGKITFSRHGKNGGQADDTDTDETSRPSLVGGGRAVRRGRTLKRVGSTSTSTD